MHIRYIYAYKKKNTLLKMYKSYVVKFGKLVLCKDKWPISNLFFFLNFNLYCTVCVLKTVSENVLGQKKTSDSENIFFVPWSMPNRILVKM